jgi:putative PIN family toxin of toxin-antitoxin system
LRIVIDTNVLISAAFFAGQPLRILMSCIAGRFQLALSPDILMEYTQVGDAFTRKRANPDFENFLATVLAHAVIADPPALHPPICRDPHDDKFLVCALATGAEVIATGDRDLLSLSGRLPVRIMRPKEFVDRYLRS